MVSGQKESSKYNNGTRSIERVGESRKLYYEALKLTLFVIIY